MPPRCRICNRWMLIPSLHTWLHILAWIGDTVAEDQRKCEESIRKLLEET